MRRCRTKQVASPAKAIKAVTRDDVVVVEKIATGQGRVAADRARTALSGLFAWAIEHRYCDATPVTHIKHRVGKGGGRKRIVKVWRATDVVGGDYGRIVKLLILTGQRREEIGRLAWAEIVEVDDGPALSCHLSGPRTMKPSHPLID
jgi:integrase